MEDIHIEPIGEVISEVEDVNEMPLNGNTCIVKIKPEYVPALLRIEENSHIWILCWFHKARRDTLQVTPLKVNPNLPKYGVFAVRAFMRPNPIALTLVKLIKVENGLLYVEGMDAIVGTPVLDIKPYYEREIIFSARTSYLKFDDDDKRLNWHRKTAYDHTQKEGLALEMGVRMAMLAEDRFGQLQDETLTLKVEGSGELADTLQGITRARFSNPPRFTFAEQAGAKVTFMKQGEQLVIQARRDFTVDELKQLSCEALFIVTR